MFTSTSAGSTDEAMAEADSIDPVVRAVRPPEPRPSESPVAAAAVTNATTPAPNARLRNRCERDRYPGGGGVGGYRGGGGGQVPKSPQYEPAPAPGLLSPFDSSRQSPPQRPLRTGCEVAMKERSAVRHASTLRKSRPSSRFPEVEDGDSANRPAVVVSRDPLGHPRCRGPGTARAEASRTST